MAATHRLGESAFHSRTLAIFLPSSRGTQALASLFERLLLRLGTQSQGTGQTGGRTHALATCRTGQTILCREAYRHNRSVEGLLGVFPPIGRDLAFGTGRLSLLPVQKELGLVIAALTRLPTR